MDEEENEREEESRDDFTNSEREIEAQDDTTADEAHRIGEFNELRDSIENLRAMISDMRDMLVDFIANGTATIRENDDNDDDKEIELTDIPGIDDLDLSID